MITVQRPTLGAEELEAVRKVFDTRWLGMGATTKQFEDCIRDFTGAKHVIAVNTGTSALHIVLASLDLQPAMKSSSFAHFRGLGAGDPGRRRQTGLL